MQVCFVSTFVKNLDQEERWFLADKLVGMYQTSEYDKIEDEYSTTCFGELYFGVQKIGLIPGAMNIKYGFAGTQKFFLEHSTIHVDTDDPARPPEEQK